MAKKDRLKQPQYYINRELSWLEFNKRVLEEAQDSSNPLLERVKFLAIVSSNLDEFFMVRVAGLKKQVAAGITKPCPAGFTPLEQLSLISRKVHSMVHELYKCFDEVTQALKKYNIQIVAPDELTIEQKDFLNNYFDRDVYPVLTPMGLDACHPFPLILSTSLNIIFSLEKKDNSSQAFSIVQVPDVLPRFIRLPGEKNAYDFVLLGQVIMYYYEVLFPGFKLREALAFRITRDSDLEIYEEESYDLLKEIEAELINRRRGAAVRLEINEHASDDVVTKLKKELDIEDEDIYRINGPLNLRDFMAFPDLIDIDKLKDVSMPTQPVPGISDDDDIFEKIRQRDIFLHHPYHSFTYVINLIAKASVDPDVLAIKMTLYRVSGDSPIVKALIEAAEKGKQVTAIVELKARFDEERNIEWAKKLERAGVHVIYGLVRLKTHAKAALIIRREPGGIKRYIHMSTGNYNDTTSRLYTDIGLMTADEAFGADISALYNVLTAFSHPLRWQKITIAPEGLRKKIIQLIQREARRSTKNQPGRIIAKMNSLVDQEVICNLYEAASAGVKIDLIVRGICCLKSQVPRISKNIKVISIVDRFLEHSRIFYFKNGGSDDLYLSSADWMPRNLDRRVELFFPVDDEQVKKEVMNVLDAALKDTVKARILQSDGSYKRVPKKKKKIPFRSQIELYKKACEAVAKTSKREQEKYIPYRSPEKKKVV
jgi:polyphosphate kinase